MRILNLIPILMIAATPAAAFEIKQVEDPAELIGEYPYHILGLKPGVSFEDVKAVADERGLPVYVQSGTMTVGQGASGVGVKMDFGFRTRGFESMAGHRYDSDWEYLQGELTTDATGSVAVELKRGLAFDPTDAPSYEAFRAQVVGEFGEPTYTDEGATNVSMVWLHDAEGNKIESVERDSLGQVPLMPNCGGSARFNIVQPDDVVTECSVRYGVSYMRLRESTRISFSLMDQGLRDADRIEAAKQLIEEIEGGGKASNLDL